MTVPSAMLAVGYLRFGLGNSATVNGLVLFPSV